MNDDELRDMVRDCYTEVAREGVSCCGPSSACCGGGSPARVSRGVGYGEEELAAVPRGADLGLGCGNPVALASLAEGETVLDLGSGGGLDCFLAAERVGESGRVIGVDMTPEMLRLARRNAAEGGYRNVEFRLGEIENLPVRDGEADAVISNCVINLSPDKPRVFREAFRALKSGGRLLVSDLVLLRPLPERILRSAAAYAACVAGAALKDDYLQAIREAGFQQVEVLEETSFPLGLAEAGPALKDLAESLNASPRELEVAAASLRSIRVRAVKP